MIIYGGQPSVNSKSVCVITATDGIMEQTQWGLVVARSTCECRWNDIGPEEVLDGKK